MLIVNIEILLICKTLFDNLVTRNRISFNRIFSRLVDIFLKTYQWFLSIWLTKKNPALEKN